MLTDIDRPQAYTFAVSPERQRATERWCAAMDAANNLLHLSKHPAYRAKYAAALAEEAAASDALDIVIATERAESAADDYMIAARIESLDPGMDADHAAHLHRFDEGGRYTSGEPVR